MYQRIIGAVLAAAFAAITFGATAGTAIAAGPGGPPTNPPVECVDPAIPCNDDYGWTLPGDEQ